jgi:hypothetical protein
LVYRGAQRTLKLSHAKGKPTTQKDAQQQHHAQRALSHCKGLRERTNKPLSSSSSSILQSTIILSQAKYSVFHSHTKFLGSKPRERQIFRVTNQLQEQLVFQRDFKQVICLLFFGDGRKNKEKPSNSIRKQTWFLWRTNGIQSFIGFIFLVMEGRTSFLFFGEAKNVYSPKKSKHLFTFFWTRNEEKRKTVQLN